MTLTADIQILFKGTWYLCNKYETESSLKLLVWVDCPLNTNAKISLKALKSFLKSNYHEIINIKSFKNQFQMHDFLYLSIYILFFLVKAICFWCNLFSLKPLKPYNLTKVCDHDTIYTNSQFSQSHYIFIQGVVPLHLTSAEIVWITYTH